MKYIISVGKSRTETTWQRKEVTWATLLKRLESCKATDETVAEYKAMNKASRGIVKDCGGFVGGELKGTRRKASEMALRSLITLDIDYGRPDTLDVVRESLDGYQWCLYSTHSHTAQTPRYRIVLPLSRNVSPEEYLPIARRIAQDVGIDLFDDSTYEPSRLMYWPSRCKDGEYVFRTGEGVPVNADAVLGTYTDWTNPVEWPVSSRMSNVAIGKGLKQEDPRNKRGLIGAFCRTYTISQVIEKYLSDVYEPTAQEDRYTFLGGSTAGGLVVYEDLWAYSHHGTDPAGQKLCNAFDLVRLHKFSDLDASSAPDTPVNKLPSFTSMEDLICEDAAVTELRTKEAVQELGDISELQEEEKVDTSWMTKLRLKGKSGALQSCPYNFSLIVNNDPRLCNSVRRDAFAGKDLIVADLPWRKKGNSATYWDCSDDAGLLVYVSEVYKLEGKQALLDAWDLAISQRAIHPVRDYFKSLPKWDGTPRLDTLLADYLGAVDNELTRAMTRKHFTAAVARVMNPGCKYDTILTLIGHEGLGKSSLIAVMGGKWFNDTMSSIDGKEAMEQLRGSWLMEMGELTNYKRSTSDAYKAFISKRDDVYRPAYGRRVETFPRQCVFFATTNEKNFLKGDTGNRRFWTVECGKDMVMKNVWTELPLEKDQIWAEALEAYKAGETLFLPHALEMQARARQAENNEIAVDERQGKIEEFLKIPIPLSWAEMTLRQRQDYYATTVGIALDPTATVMRKTICAVEILIECFNEKWDDKTRYRTKDINALLKNIPNLEEAGRARVPGYGLQRIFAIKEM